MIYELSNLFLEEYNSRNGPCFLLVLVFMACSIVARWFSPSPQKGRLFKYPESEVWRERAEKFGPNLYAISVHLVPFTNFMEQYIWFFRWDFIQYHFISVSPQPHSTGYLCSDLYAKEHLRSLFFDPIHFVPEVVFVVVVVCFYDVFRGHGCYSPGNVSWRSFWSSLRFLLLLCLIGGHFLQLL